MNSDIGTLVGKGLSPVMQQALDIVRVTGNNALHPGEMSVADDPQMVDRLFACLNLIVEDQITRPRMIAAAFGELPTGAREAIKRRDKTPEPKKP